jgi:hypothetical protein
LPLGVAGRWGWPLGLSPLGVAVGDGFQHPPRLATAP